DPRGIGLAGEVAAEPGGIQAHLDGVATQRIDVEPGGRLQQLVHLPELALGGGGLSRLGGLLRVWVKLRDREITEYELHRAWVAVEQQVHVPGRALAVGA